MKLFEYEAKELLLKKGVPTPRGRIIETPEEAWSIARELGTSVAIKAQVLSGGRGKAGIVQFADGPGEALKMAEELFEKQWQGKRTKEVISRILEDSHFIANFGLALKDIRLKMVMPPGWEMTEFHGEQVSSKASDIVPQYLSPNDQMIYHLAVARGEKDIPPGEQIFEFEVEYRPLGKDPGKARIQASVEEMLSESRSIIKGDAVVSYAEMLKKIAYPLKENRKANLEEFTRARRIVSEAREKIQDPELDEILILLDRYRKTLAYGETFPGSRDGQTDSIDAVLGIRPGAVRDVNIAGALTGLAFKALSRLGASIRLVPLEGYKFFALSSGPVGNPDPAETGPLDTGAYMDPLPDFRGYERIRQEGRTVYDLSQITLTLQAPVGVKSFSFDFNFFSAEYPQYINQNFNDSFYAILRAGSTNNGKSTNIAFDSNNNAIEVDNNYFQNPFHPIPNTGTGFDYHGSTGWLRTSWPINGGEVFTLTFSIHDEGDAIFDSLVILDNFQWHQYEAVGTTDPLN